MHFEFRAEFCGAGRAVSIAPCYEPTFSLSKRHESGVLGSSHLILQVVAAESENRADSALVERMLYHLQTKRMTIVIRKHRHNARFLHCCVLRFCISDRPAIGFSQIRCLPTLAATIAVGGCVSFGRRISTTLRSISSGKPKRSGATAVTTEWALPMTYGFIGKLEPNFRLRITRPRASGRKFCARNEAAGEKTRIRATDQALTTINPASSSGRVSFVDAPASTISVCARSTPPMQNGEAVLSFDAHASSTVSAARAASARFT